MDLTGIIVLFQDRRQSPTSSLARTTAHAQNPSPTWTKPLTGAPAWPMDAQPITPAPAAQATDGGNGLDRMTIGIGIAGGLLAISGIAALNSRRRHRRQRVRATT